MLNEFEAAELEHLRNLAAKRRAAPGFAANVKYLDTLIADLEAKQNEPPDDPPQAA